jgi:hypothetical protein
MPYFQETDLGKDLYTGQFINYTIRSLAWSIYVVHRCNSYMMYVFIAQNKLLVNIILIHATNYILLD